MFSLPVVHPATIIVCDPISFFMRRIQVPIRVTVTEFDQITVLQYRCMLDTLPIDVRMGIRMTRCYRRHAIGAVSNDAMARLDVRTIELKANAVG